MNSNLQDNDITELDELAFASQTALKTLFALLHTAPGALSFMLGHFLSPCLSLGSFVHNRQAP
jgi:hypothetical protein